MCGSPKVPNRRATASILTPYGESACYGLRGGNWNNAMGNVRVSDRTNAGNTNTNRNNNYGFRPARTFFAPTPVSPSP